MSLDKRLAAIAAAPDGPQVGAFFDYDGTVISGYSAQAFYRHRMLGLDIGPVELVRTVLMSAQGIESPEDFAAFLELSLGAWKGRPLEEIEELGNSLFKHDIASRLHPEAWALVRAHQAKGHTLALASSATRFQVEPMARELEIDHVLCTPVEVIDGIITGRTSGPPLWAGGKARAVLELAETEELDLDASFAYSNGGEDIEFLETVAQPGRRGAPQAAASGGDPAELADPGVRVARRDPRHQGRRAHGRLLRRVRRRVRRGTRAVAAEPLVATPSWRSPAASAPTSGSPLAGIDVKVIRGHEHLWSARPCVFVFNHQSKLDPILVMKLLRGGFTGVAKKEAKNVPGFGQIFQLAGVAFVERGNTAQAKQAMAPAVDKVREGMSLVIAPEGTRSATPRLGRFKKGPFHIAMQAEVPMVPIIIRNAGEVMWRGAQTLRPGTVEVVVLPPVDTATWTVDTITDHVDDVRGMFLDTLADWPTGPRLELQRMSRPIQVAVLGGGSWGTTVASLAARNTPTLLWARNAETAAEINEQHTNSRYLEDRELPGALRATSDLREAAEYADVLVVGVPSHGIRDALAEAAPHVRPWVPVLSLAKGLEQGTRLRPTAGHRRGAARPPRGPARRPEPRARGARRHGCGRGRRDP